MIFKENMVVYVHFIKKSTLQEKLIYQYDWYEQCRIVSETINPLDKYIVVEVIEMPNLGLQIITELKNNEILFEYNEEIPTIEVNEVEE